MGGVEVTIAGGFSMTKTLGEILVSDMNLLISATMEEETSDKFGRNTFSILSCRVSKANSLVVVEGIVWITTSGASNA